MVVKGTDAVQVDVSITDLKYRIEKSINSYNSNREEDEFDYHICRGLKVISARSTTPAQDSAEAQVAFAIETVRELCNPMGNMHGGATATLVDMATTFSQAAIAKEGFWEFGGVSRTINVTYLKPIVLGCTVVVECSVRSIGKRSTVIQCVMKDKASGKLLALGEHGKAALASQEGTKPQISQL